MRNLCLSLVLAAFATLMFATAGAAQYGFDIDLEQGLIYDGSGTEDDPYEVPGYTPLGIIAHVGKEGHEGEPFHIEEVSMDIWHVGGGETTWDWVQVAQPCEWHEFCEWFPWGVITLNGEPCNTVGMQADIMVWTESQGYSPLLLSNKLYLHIVPEPATVTSLAGLILGAASIGWFRLRRN